MKKENILKILTIILVCVVTYVATTWRKQSSEHSPSLLYYNEKELKFIEYVCTHAQNKSNVTIIKFLNATTCIYNGRLIISPAVLEQIILYHKINNIPLPCPKFIFEGSPEILFGDKNLCIVLFYSPYCPHCRAERKVLENLHDHYNITVVMYNIFRDGNMQLWYKVASNYSIPPEGVPYTIIGDKYIALGFFHQ